MNILLEFSELILRQVFLRYLIFIMLLYLSNLVFREKTAKPEISPKIRGGVVGLGSVTGGNSGILQSLISLAKNGHIPFCAVFRIADFPAAFCDLAERYSPDNLPLKFRHAVAEQFSEPYGI